MLLNPASSKSISAVNSPLFRANFAYPYTTTRSLDSLEIYVRLVEREISVPYTDQRYA